MPHYLFVTGRLAEEPLRRLLATLAPAVGFEYSVAVMPITIAALITPRWLARRLKVPAGVTAVVVPGHCSGDLSPVEEVAAVPVERGPSDLRELPEYFGREDAGLEYGGWDIEIIARIDRADRLDVGEIVDRAASLTEDGADIVLLGGSGQAWPGLTPVVEELRDDGIRVALADVTPLDLVSAIGHGVELVFPADTTQREAAVGLGCEVVVTGGEVANDVFFGTIEEAIGQGFRFRVDPGVRPIGLGLAESIGAYLEVHRRWPKASLTMSLGTVTESTPADSAPLVVVLLGMCQELGVGSVVVSQNSNWSRSAVRECHLARQWSRYVAHAKRPAVDLETRLLMLRDAAALEFGREELDRLAEVLRDPSPRLYAEQGRLHAICAGKHLESDDPYDLFDQVVGSSDRSFDAGRAFYLGYEMAKAMTALTLGKTYRQDEALNWGLLTQRELTRLERRALRLARLRGECDEAREYFEDDDLDENFEESDA